MFKHAVIRPENHTHYISILYIYICIEYTMYIYIFIYQLRKTDFKAARFPSRSVSRQSAGQFSPCFNTNGSVRRSLTHPRHTHRLWKTRGLFGAYKTRESVFQPDPKYSRQYSCSAGQPVTLHSEIPPQKTLRKRRNYYYWLADHLTYTRPAKRSHRG